MKILNFGSLNIDYSYDMADFVRAGETVSARGLTINVGGKGLNQSVALAKAGAEVYHAGLIGADGKFLKNFLEENGVNASLVRETEGASGHAIIQVNAGGQNCIIIYGGANRRISEQYVGDVLENFGEGDILLLQNEINMTGEIARMAKEKGMTVVLNPSPAENIEVPPGLVDYFIMNETEAMIISGAQSVDAVKEKMLEKFPNAKTVMTLGSEGAIYFDKCEEVFVPAKKVKAVDTTAAGDTFTGYFIHMISSGADVTAAMETATKASAVTVTRKGAAASIPIMSEIM